MSNPVSDLPRPLPIRPRPNAGDSIASYIRRLARANHLRPNFLRRHLRRPPGTDKTIDLDRLAAVAGRTISALEHALADLDGAHHLPQRHQRSNPDDPSTRRRARADLFAAIRRDARRNAMSIRALADRHGVHRRTVVQALASPVPKPRKQPPPRTSRLDPFKDTIDTMLRSDHDNPHQRHHTAQRAFTRLVAEHRMTGISYSTVRGYVAHARIRIPRRHDILDGDSAETMLDQMTPEELVGLAIDAAHEGLNAGELPIGAVVAMGEKIIGRAHTQEKTQGRRLVHADLLAMQQADQRLGWTPRTAPLVLAVNLEPCLMCLGAAMSLGVTTVYYGLEAPSDGAAGIANVWRPTRPDMPFSQVPQLAGGIRRPECRALFARYATTAAESGLRDWAQALADLSS